MAKITQADVQRLKTHVASMTPEARKKWQAENLRKLQAGEFTAAGGLGGLIAGPVLEFKRQEKIKKMELTAQAAAATQRRRLRGLGRASTILTSGRGVLGEAPVARKTLLGQ